MKDNEEFEDDELDLEFTFENNKGKFQIFYEDISSIGYNSIMVGFYKFRNTLFYRYIHIGVMIVSALIYWITMLGQIDIQICDGEDEENIIFHLPQI